MKTNAVEIFQTLRACLQPYAARGYTSHTNSETEYDLWSEKNIVDKGQKVTERFFASLYIEGNLVILKTNDKDKDALYENASTLKVENLDNEKLKEIENLVEIVHIHFKEKEWI